MFCLACFFFFFVLSLLYKISISCPTRNIADEIELRGRIGWTCRMKARAREGGGWRWMGGWWWLVGWLAGDGGLADRVKEKRVLP